MQQKAYIVKHNDIKTRMASRSGGVFTAISDVVLGENGVIYGSAIDEHYQAEHRRAKTQEERDSFRGSKYVQSRMDTCYRMVSEDLALGNTVLFSGTACQIAGLKAFSDNSSERLLTMDIVCHGVPSPQIWNAFLGWMEKKYRGKVDAVNFRDKRYGWMAHFESVVIKGHLRVADYYRAMFYKHYSLRPSCFQCPYANLNRVSDITIADAWGVDRNHPHFNDDKGVSLVIVNTEKGLSYFKKAEKYLNVIEVSLDGYLQPNLRRPSKMPADRELFWQDFHAKGFEYVSHIYGQNTVKGNLMSLAKRILGRTGLTKYVKRYLGI